MKKRKEKERFKEYQKKERVMIQGVPKIFRIRNFIKILHTCMSWSKCMTCISLRSGLWLSKICDASMPHFHTYLKLHSKTLVLGYEKEGKIPNALVRFHIHWAIERIIWGTYICFTKLIKPLDRWLIKEWMTSIITVLSCNCPRTWKIYTPHRDQDKRVDKNSNLFKLWKNTLL
jgi:hypothetical protein